MRQVCTRRTRASSESNVDGRGRPLKWAKQKRKLMISSTDKLVIFGYAFTHMTSRRILIVILCLTAIGLLLLFLPIHLTLRRGYVMRDRNETIRLIEEFHDRLNRGQFDQIYENASSALQRSGGYQGVTGTMQQINQNYGAFQRVGSSKVEVVVSAPVEIRAVYDSVFEKGRATEWFVFVIEGNDIRLRTYFVSPLRGGSPTS